MSRNARIILVIDDDLARPDQARLFTETYPLEGFTYRFAADGDEALQLLEAGLEFALILLDMRFEGAGSDHGLDILDRLVERGCRAPVLILSSNRDPEVIIGAWRRGAKDYVVKWSDNPAFYEDLKQAVADHARATNAPGFQTRELRRSQIKARVGALLTRHSTQRLHDIVAHARRFKEDLGLEWQHRIPFPSDHENYIQGWNAPEEELARAESEGALLYLNMDLGKGCLLNCPHCFTKEGAIDERGRKPVHYGLLKERILEAKTLGLKAVRILGTGEPTQWAAENQKDLAEEGDFLDFVRFLRANDVIPLVFTRGQLIGNDKWLTSFYKQGVHPSIQTGVDLVKALREIDASVFLGVSSIFPDVNNELVGRGALGDYDEWCKRALRMLVEAGFNRGNPTRLAVESPITTLNIREMPVRLVLFQMLNISPCMNVFMVTGRTKTYGLEEIAGPPETDFFEMYATVTHFMRRLGIKGKIGPYAGTKECHDVSNGMYLTLNGDVYPCPGYENIQDFVGSIRTHSMEQIWKNNPFGRHRQSVCPPKIGSYFPPDFERQIETRLQHNASRYDDEFEIVCDGLGLPRGA